MKDVIVWIDVETTGLNPWTGDKLLEVAALVTDVDLNLLDDHGYHAVVFHENRDQVRNIASDYVKEMHDTNGLWDKVVGPDAVPLTIIDRELLEYIQRFAPDERSARLAGNSVRLDANFIDRYLPKVASHLHYRILDVSSLSFEAQIQGVEVYHKRGTHRAMDDIRESIEELKYLRKELYKSTPVW